MQTITDTIHHFVTDFYNSTGSIDLDQHRDATFAVLKHQIRDVKQSPTAEAYIYLASVSVSIPLHAFSVFWSRKCALTKVHFQFIFRNRK